MAALLLAACATLAVGQDKDKERKHTPESKPAPAPAPKPEPKPAPAPRAESRPEPRRESPRPESRPPSESRPSRESRPTGGPPPSTPPPTSRPPNREATPIGGPTSAFALPGPEARPSGRETRPAGSPGPEGRTGREARPSGTPTDPRPSGTPAPGGDPRTGRDGRPAGTPGGPTTSTPTPGGDPRTGRDGRPAGPPGGPATSTPTPGGDPRTGRDFRGGRDARPTGTPTPDVRPGREVRPDPGPRPSGAPTFGRDSRPDAGRPDAGRPSHGREVVRTRGGGEIHRTPSGAIREVRTASGAIIRHSPSGARHVEVNRSGGRVVFANATGRRGYVQRPLVIRDHSYVQRTYILNGVPRAALFRPWSHSGRVYHIYTPVYHYRPAFYSWVWSPWSRPVRYGWGWERASWYGYYGGYFTPYRTYVSPSFWLADFLIATTLEAAYLAQRASTSEPPMVYNSGAALTPEVKDAIADEVKRQMEYEREAQGRSASYDETPAIFTDRGPRVFLVSNPTVAYAGSQECSLAEGDVLQLVGRPSMTSDTAEVKVLASRGDSCRKGSYLSVPVTDLQEMQNQLRANLDTGMSNLQKEQGRNGLPSLPSGASGTLSSAYADEVRPDGDAVDQINQVVQEANRSEQDIISEGPQGGGGTISLGMTPGEVERILGQPKNTVNLGNKRIFVYKELKVTFLNGRVSDVQ